MKLLSTPLLLAVATAPASASLFQSSERNEYSWCCQNAECWTACAVLCEDFNSQDYCVGEALHPGSPAFQNGGGSDLNDFSAIDALNEYFDNNEELDRPAWMVNGDYGGLENLDISGTTPDTSPQPGDGFFGRRGLHTVISGCGPPPIIIPSNPGEAASPPVITDELLDWFQCYLEFFFGNDFAKRHCERSLPIGQCNAGPFSGGDPHFMSWVGEWYDYHGECDLTFLHAPSFAHGLGLDIHVRTKIRQDFSYIESVAVKIGDDIIEVGGFGQYSVNGVSNADLDDARLGPFDIVHSPESKKVHYFTIGEGDHLVKIKTLKDFVSVSLGDDPSPADFIDSTGMLGRFGSGMLYGRDGKTVFTTDNIDDFGQEWQVRPDEPMLFENVDRAPQYPAKCRLPHVAAREERRLGERGVTEEEAQAACSEWSPRHQSKCVYDVLATGDLELAAAGGY